MNGEEVIAVKNVKKYFKTVKAIDGIDLTIHKGEYLALLGPNGAGKTTLVEMIEGIQKPDSGEIRIMGKKWKGNEESLHKMIGLSLQETEFFDKLTVAETFRLFSSFYGIDFARCEKLMELVNLQEKRKSFVVNLSGGQRQKLALGISLLNYPRILLLDEPTTGLDPVARREIWKILKDLRREQNTSMVLTTHYMEEAEILCDRIVIIDKGKIIAGGTFDQLLSEFDSAQVVDFTIAGNIAEPEFPCVDGIKKITWNSNTNSARIIVKDIVRFLPVFSSFISEKSYHVTSFQCRRMTLDDLFISLTGRTLND